MFSNKVIFDRARLRLAAGYVATALLISLLFSAGIYGAASRQIDRGFRRAETLIGNRFAGEPFREQIVKRVPQFLKDELDRAKNDLIFDLIWINVAAAGLSAIGGYYLAGATLDPIRRSMNAQKRFIGDAAHELRTPITALKASTEAALFAPEIKGTEAEAVLRGNLEEIARLEKLAEAILELNAERRANGNRIQIELRELAEKAAARIAPLAERKKLSVSVEGGGKAAAVADEIERALLAVLDNAVKYAPEGGKVAVVCAVKGKNAVISVADNGPGINDAEKTKIFERFYRADEARASSPDGGFGLGLSIAKKIMLSHKGNIAVKSGEKGGAVFTLSWPA